MRIVLTGGAGFIGSHVAERLVADGHEVLVYDAFTKQYPAVIKRRNVAGALGLPGCTLIEGDLLETQRFDAVFSAHAVDVVVHVAAAMAWSGPDAAKACVETNVLGTHAVVERCRKHNVRKLILLSSAAVYGLRHQGPCKETDPTDRPLSVYAASKRAAESIAWLGHHQFGLDAFVLRPFSVYGPRQRPDQAVYRFGRTLMAQERVELSGDGSAVLDLLYVGDLVDAMAKAVEAVQGFEIINVGTGRSTTMLETVQKLAGALGVPASTRSGPADPTLPPYAVADPTKAERLLGWRAAVDADEGCKRFVSWLRAEEFEDEA